MDLAVLIIGYSRPKGISSLLDNLFSNRIRDIYIALDGPKNSVDITTQNEIREIVLNFKGSLTSRIHLLDRTQNLGVAGGVLNAIDWFFSHEEMGIVLEDDLIVSNDFFPYCLHFLDMFREDKEVWMISGTQMQTNRINSKQISWANYPMIWGWASWREKWFEMRKSLLRKKPIQISNMFNRRYLFWAVGGNRALAGKVDTWDTQLAFEFMVQKKLCLLPPVNLISNIGNDGVASHTKGTNSGMNLKISSLNAHSYSTKKPSQLSLFKYNTFLEEEVFKIKWYHIFLPYYSFLFDSINFPKPSRRLSLNNRSDWNAN
jgi:predicted transport protein